jgi:hypothetical protein
MAIVNRQASYRIARVFLVNTFIREGRKILRRSLSTTEILAALQQFG